MTESRLERHEMSNCETWDLSGNGDDSGEVSGVGGVEYPSGGPLLLVGEDGVLELSAPSPEIFGVPGTGGLRK